MAGELAWGIKLFRVFFAPIIPYGLIIFCVRIAWAFLILQYQALGLFLDSLTEKKLSLKIPQKILLGNQRTGEHSIYILAFFDHGFIQKWSACLHLIPLHPSTDQPLEIIVMRHTVHYVLPDSPLSPESYFIILRKIRKLDIT